MINESYGVRYEDTGCGGSGVGFLYGVDGSYVSAVRDSDCSGGVSVSGEWQCSAK